MKLLSHARTGVCAFALAPVALVAGAVVAGLSAGIVAAQEAPKSKPAAVALYRDAVTFQNKGLYDLAADEWEKFLKTHAADPLAPKAQHYLGVCRLQQKKFDDAVAAFEVVIEKHPKVDLLDQTYLNLGLAQYSLAQGGKAEAFDQAAESFGTLATKFPESKSLGQALYYRGESLYARGKKAEAAAAYSQMLEKQPQHALRGEALYALGVAHEELGKPSEAGATYDTFIKEFPKSPLYAEVLMRRAETLFAAGKFADAEKWFAAAAASKDFPLADQATVRQAASLYEQKKFAEAAAVYASLAAKFPQSSLLSAATLSAGNCYYLAGDFAEAEVWLRKALESDSGPEAGHWLARVLLKQSKPAEALTAVEKALPKATGTPFAVQLLMDQADAVYDIEGRRGDAIKLYAAIAAKHAGIRKRHRRCTWPALPRWGRATTPARPSTRPLFSRAFPTMPWRPTLSTWPPNRTCSLANSTRPKSCTTSFSRISRPMPTPISGACGVACRCCCKKNTTTWLKPWSR